MIQIPATGLALAAGTVFPHVTWVKHLLLANSLVGFVYMHREYEALRDTGSTILGVTVYTPTYVLNFVVNALVHVLIPIVVWRKMVAHTARIPRLWYALYLLAIPLFDLQRLYPTENGLLPYIVAHVILLTASSVVVPGLPPHQHRT